MTSPTPASRDAKEYTVSRWHRAAERALAQGVTVRQVASTGQWIATSGSAADVAYALDVTGAVAHGCDCPAGQVSDPVCKHRAAWYLLIGALDPTTIGLSPAGGATGAGGPQ